MEQKKIITLKIDQLNHYARGISFEAGQIFHTPYTLPGEVVQVQILGKNRGVFDCKLLKIVESSPKRAHPPCAYFGECGGCDLQHVEYQEQLAIKTLWVRQLFSAFAGLVIHNIIPSDHTIGYRNRVTLHHNKETIGLFRPYSHEVVSIDHCKIASDLLNLKLKSLGQEALEGPETFELREDEGAAFLQINRCQNKNLTDKVVAYCVGRKNQEILELYCGAGNFSFALAELARKVVAVDGDVKAIARADDLKKEQKARVVEFVHAPVHDAVFEMCQSLKAFDAIVCDPPREGLKQTAHLIHRLKAKKIVYVSCDPFSLLKDALELKTRGYQLLELSPLDMFPQTRHVEIVALFANEKATGAH